MGWTVIVAMKVENWWHVVGRYSNIGPLISYLPVNETYTPTTEILLGMKF
jgi:hypothetical protein